MKKKVISGLMALTCVFSSLGIYTSNYVHAAEHTIYGVDVDESWVPLMNEQPEALCPDYETYQRRLDQGIFKYYDKIENNWEVVQLEYWKPSTEERKISKKYKKGDVDFNGKLDVTDITIIAAHIKGKKAFSRIPKAKAWMADINNDGIVNVSDITKLAAKVKGKI